MRKSACLCLLLAAGCRDPEPLVFGNGLMEGDAAYAGQQQFLHETWGTEILDSWPPADFMLDLMADEAFGPQFRAFGFVEDPAREFPVGLARGSRDPEKIHETCAMCHVAPLPDGTLWLGAPNSRLDIGAFRNAVNARWVAAGNPPLLTDLEVEKNAQLGPGRTGAESGSYPRAVPADFPPYFDLGARTHLNYMGTGQNVRTEIAFALFTFGAGRPNAEEARVKFPEDAAWAPLVAFMGGLVAPPAPPQDATLVARGAAVFTEAGCDTCHRVDAPELEGVVTLDTSTTATQEYLPGEHPDFEHGSIRTSRAHRILQDGDDSGESSGPDAGLGNLLQFIFDQGLAIRRTDGYRISTLTGLWATAPYLHNGSVPTLQDLLTPAEERPAAWTNGTFVVDTTVFGNGNEGHEFGASLSEADKAALVAYLLSL